MKVRWTTGSVRFRITPAELERIRRGEPVGAALPLPGGGGWDATILASPDGQTRLRGGAHGALLLYLSPDDRERLAEPAPEGVYFRDDSVNAPDGLRFFVEKDFPCAHPRPAGAAEEDTETFAPPPGFADRAPGGD